MVRANQRDPKHAMDCYSEAIGMQDVPEDVRAMALYNRALLHAANKNFTQAESDLNTILTLPGALRQIKLAARQKLERMKLRQAAAPPA